MINWNEIVEEKINALTTLVSKRPRVDAPVVSERDRAFIFSLLSFNAEALALRHALEILEKYSDRYISSDEQSLLDRCFFHPERDVVIKRLGAMKEILVQKDLEHAPRISIREILGISEDVLRILWRIARSLIDDIEYVYAYNLLFLLLSIEPFLIEGWIAYGYVNIQMQSFNTALNALYTARVLSSGERIDIDVMICSCYIDMHNFEDAKHYFLKAAAHPQEELEKYPYFRVMKEKLVRYRAL